MDLVIPENDWNQKRQDVFDYKIDIVVMGSDWDGNEKFECLRDICDVVYLPRTEGISTTKIKKDLNMTNVLILSIENNKSVNSSVVNI